MPQVPTATTSQVTPPYRKALMSPQALISLNILYDRGILCVEEFEEEGALKNEVLMHQQSQFI